MEGYHRIEVQGDERAFVANKFKCSEVCKVERIQNDKVAEKYALNNEHMEVSDERFLFHGSDVESAYLISQSNVDFRLCGKNGVAYGQGAYFSPNYGTSVGYCIGRGQKRRMLLCKVQLGNWKAIP